MSCLRRYWTALLLPLLLCTTAGAEESASAAWRLPGLDTGLTGGLHAVYADRSGDGMADVQVGLSVLSDKELFGTTGARRIGYRVAGVFPVLDMLEFGIDIAGSSVAGLGGLNEEINNFGDIRLRGKYYTRHNAFGFAGIAGYDLPQGVQDRSRVADVASPLLGFGISYFGRECKAPNAFRLHLNSLYVYDRTINFLDGQRTPQDFERFAWQMRDYTHLDIVFGVEYELPGLLPILEYKTELPLDTPGGGFEPVHMVSPGVKFNPIDALAITVGLDFGFGGDSGAGPQVPLVDAQLGLIYRFKGEILRPAAVAHTEKTPLPEPAEETTLTPVTSPVTKPVLPEPPNEMQTEEQDTDEPPATSPQPAAEPEPESPEPDPQPGPDEPEPEPQPEETPAETAPEAEPEPESKPAPTPKTPEKPKTDAGDGPVDLDQFAD